jgi:hypothetical protein
MADLSEGIKKRLRNEGIELGVSAGSVDVPGGHLAVILTLSFPDSLRDQRLKAEQIANEECITYFQHVPMHPSKTQRIE